MEPKDTDTGSTPVAKTAKGYGKRPLWQWILIYIVVAIIVYGAIYLIFFNHGGSSTGTYHY